MRTSIPSQTSNTRNMSEQFPGTSTVGEGRAASLCPQVFWRIWVFKLRLIHPNVPMLGHGIALPYQGPGYSIENLSRVFPLSL